MIAKYHAECWATGKSKKEIQTEIDYQKSLFTMDHPNPFPHSGAWANERILTLEEILNNSK